MGYILWVGIALYFTTGLILNLLNLYEFFIKDKINNKRKLVEKK